MPSAFDLSAERFACFVVTDERGGERRDRTPVEPGEIRIADRAYLRPDRIVAVLAAGGDVVVRAAWRNPAWRNPAWRNPAWRDAWGEPLDVTAVLREGAEQGLIDRPVWLRRRGEALPLRLRLVAVKKSPQAAKAAHRKARREARRPTALLNLVYREQLFPHRA